MHELGVVFNIIKSVERVAAENDLTKVASVTLELGEVSTVIPSYLTDCWRWAADKKDLLRDSELMVEEIPAVTCCGSCGGTYPTVKYGKICPHCKSGDTWLIRGNEVNIKEIEAC